MRASFKSWLCALALLCFAWEGAAAASDFEFRGGIEPKDPTSRLLAFYVNRFTPEELTLTIDGEPDASGRYRDLYMDLTGVMIEGVRLDKLTFRMLDVQFNAPENWASGDVECKSALRIYAYGHILQDDINRSLKEIGRAHV